MLKDGELGCRGVILGAQFILKGDDLSRPLGCEADLGTRRERDEIRLEYASFSKDK